MRRWLRLVGVIGVMSVAAGAAYQAIAERRAFAAYPPPGQLVSVGEHRLHLRCIGAGEPTVVLEAGLGNDGTFWTPVQEGLADYSRVCAYDRAGLGWSEEGPRPRSADQITEELAALWDAIGGSGPKVIVGHSNGGLHALIYAARNPAEVAGLVLVDPNPGTSGDCESLPFLTRTLYGGLVGLAPVGIPRALLPVLFPLDSSPLPEREREIHAALRGRASALRTLWSEWKQTCQLQSAAEAAAEAGVRVPVIILSAESRPPAQDATWILKRHREMAAVSPTGSFRLAEASGHWIQLDSPEAVIRAVRDVMAAAGESDY